MKTLLTSTAAAAALLAFVSLSGQNLAMTGGSIHQASADTDHNGKPVMQASADTDHNGKPVMQASADTDHNGKPVMQASADTDHNGKPVMQANAGLAPIGVSSEPILV